MVIRDSAQALIELDNLNIKEIDKDHFASIRQFVITGDKVQVETHLAALEKDDASLDLRAVRAVL